MKKMAAVFKREYLQAVRKKSFIIMTFLFPVLMAGMFFLPGLMMVRGIGEKKVVVLDGTGKLREPFVRGGGRDPVPGRRDVSALLNIEYIDRAGDEQLLATAKPYLNRLALKKQEGQLDGVLIVPVDSLTNPKARLRYYTRTSTDFIGQERLSGLANDGIRRLRLRERGLRPEEIDQLMTRIRVDSLQVSKTGEQKSGGAAGFMIGFLLVALLFIPSFVYGLEIMRGIIQEKTDRVVEVLISSMRPADLLVGKIMGVAAVGLTQISVWLIMLGGAGAFAAATASFAGVNVRQFIRPSVFIYFGIFFVLGYLTYVCVYAVGGAISNSDKDANQVIQPIIMIMMLPWFLMAAIITNPDSNLAVGFSLAPVFGPMTMFVRTLVSEPPLWHVVVSIVVSILTILAFFWITTKIFRVGILSYGKRPTIPELWRWLKVA